MANDKAPKNDGKKTIKYVGGGPDRIFCGNTRFDIGDPKEVPADLADALLKKTTVIFEEV